MRADSSLAVRPAKAGMVNRCYGAGDEGVAPSLLTRQPMERPMKPNDLSRSLVAFDQASALVTVVEETAS